MKWLGLIREEPMVSAVLGVFLCLLVFIVYGTYVSTVRWETFASQHHCRITTESAPKTETLLIGGKVSTVYTPSTKGYTCDDGVTYWR